MMIRVSGMFFFLIFYLFFYIVVVVVVVVVLISPLLVVFHFFLCVCLWLVDSMMWWEWWSVGVGDLGYNRDPLAKVVQKSPDGLDKWPAMSKDPSRIPDRSLGIARHSKSLKKIFFLNPGTFLYEDFWRIVESECSRREQMLQDCLQDRLGNIGTPPRRLVVNAVVSMLEIRTRCRLPPLGSFAYFIHRHRIWGGRPMAPPVPSHVSRDPCRTHMS